MAPHAIQEGSDTFASRLPVLSLPSECLAQHQHPADRPQLEQLRHFAHTLTRPGICGEHIFQSDRRTGHPVAFQVLVEH